MHGQEDGNSILLYGCETADQAETFGDSAAKKAVPKTRQVLGLGGDDEADLALVSLCLPGTMPSTPSGRVESLPFVGRTRVSCSHSGACA